MVTLGADILPPRAVGSMTGLSGTGAGLGGIVFTMATGWLVDRFSYFPVFVIAGTAPLVGTGLLLWLLGEIEPLVVAERQPVAR